MQGLKGVSVDGVVFTDGMQLRQATLDHVVPRVRRGSNRPNNLITCCAECNAKRAHRSVPKFAAALVSGALGAPIAPEYKQIVLRVRAAQRRKLPLGEQCRKALG